jgi:hypothetical protein
MHTLFGKISLILSLIGIIGGIFVPIFGTIDNTYWGEWISSEIDWFFFTIFTIVSLIGIILGYHSKEKDRFGYYALIIGFVGFLYNGFFSLLGFGFLTSPLLLLICTKT